MAKTELNNGFGLGGPIGSKYEDLSKIPYGTALRTDVTKLAEGGAGGITNMTDPIANMLIGAQRATASGLESARKYITGENIGKTKQTPTAPVKKVTPPNVNTITQAATAPSTTAAQTPMKVMNEEDIVRQKPEIIEVGPETETPYHQNLGENKIEYFGLGGGETSGLEDVKKMLKEQMAQVVGIPTAQTKQLAEIGLAQEKIKSDEAERRFGLEMQDKYRRDMLAQGGTESDWKRGLEERRVTLAEKQAAAERGEKSESTYNAMYSGNVLDISGKPLTSPSYTALNALTSGIKPEEVQGDINRKEYENMNREFEDFVKMFTSKPEYKIGYAQLKKVDPEAYRRDLLSRFYTIKEPLMRQNMLIQSGTITPPAK